MNEIVHIVGQGMAGSMLGWACERAGIAFRIFDAGHASAASWIGAGLVSPLTGKRLVPTWRFAEWRGDALACYRELERALGVALVREMRIRRVFRDAGERERFSARLTAPEVAAWVESVDDEGLWLHGALQVETGRLIAALRERWQRAGVLVEDRIVPETEPNAVEAAAPRTIWCIGAAAVNAITVGRNWEPSKGELLSGRMDGLAPDVVLNDGQWVLPSPDGRVRVGATFRRDDLAGGPSAQSRTFLLAAAERLGGQPLRDVEVVAGLRVTLPDRRPVAGWLDAAGRIGVLGALAAKGALWAPVLAAQWVADDLHGGGIDAEARADRFGGGSVGGAV